MANWFDANPEMAQQVLQMLQQQAGRQLTDMEIDQARTALAGEQLNPDALRTFATQLANPTPQVDPAATAGNKGAVAGKVAGVGGMGSGNPPPVIPPPMTGGGTTGGGTTGGNTSGNATPLFSDFAVPTYKSPTFKQAPAFQAPTLEEAQNAPGYQFGVQQGEKALMQSRAAQGLTRTGGTLKDILDYGRQAATQNYGNVFNQSKNAYDTNYKTQYQDPNTWNYQTANDDFYAQLAGNEQKLNVGHTAFNDELAGANSQFNNSLAGSRFGLDVALARYAPQFAQWQTSNSNAQRQAELTNNSDWAKYINEQNTFWTNQSNPFSRYLSLAQLGAGTA